MAGIIASVISQPARAIPPTLTDGQFRSLAQPWRRTIDLAMLDVGEHCF
jgi:hypothetical protein